MPDTTISTEAAQKSVKVSIDLTAKPAKSAAVAPSKTATPEKPDAVASVSLDAAKEPVDPTTTDAPAAPATEQLVEASCRPSLISSELGIALVLGFTLAVLGAIWVISPTKSALDPARCETDAVCEVQAG